MEVQEVELKKYKYMINPESHVQPASKVLEFEWSPNLMYSQIDNAIQ